MLHIHYEERKWLHIRSGHSLRMRLNMVLWETKKRTRYNALLLEKLLDGKGCGVLGQKTIELKNENKETLQLRCDGKNIDALDDHGLVVDTTDNLTIWRAVVGCQERY